MPVLEEASLKDFVIPEKDLEARPLLCRVPVAQRNTTVCGR